MVVSMIHRKIAVIAGAGPAGLTAALELLRRSDICPIVLEADSQVGGISKTIEYHGNRMDLGGHRFFSKSDWVMRWWQEILPVDRGQVDSEGELRINYQQQMSNFRLETVGQDSSDSVMLLRRRLSRIFYRRRFYDYPLALNASTLRNLGVKEAMRIGLSYGWAQLGPRSPEISLEDFLINRFGNRLYRTFFKEYTEKVWGVACEDISAEWGAQRIKGLSVAKAIGHALVTPFRSFGDSNQKRSETSLIERFLYPKLGPGQMWEEVARRVTALGGDIRLSQRVVGVDRDGLKVVAVHVQDTAANSLQRIPCDYLVSTIPVRELIAFLKPADSDVLQIADRLPYRDFMTVGLLLRRMNDRKSGKENGMPPDNWIYVQDPDVQIGRIQVFNNWSPALVADQSTIWLGLEYFCREGDDLWSMSDGKFVDLAVSELEKIGLIDRKDVIDGTVVRVPKAYPAYFGTYSEFGKIRSYLDGIANLYPIGRNGMHRYNNQDHSMLAASAAVTSIVNGGSGKSDIWRVNVENEYHEEITESERRQTAVP
jgi:protoporphyrinogen oxidase